MLIIHKAIEAEHEYTKDCWCCPLLIDEEDWNNLTPEQQTELLNKENTPH